jgi:uncharacterized protein YbjQ (UPF0145 family)
MADNDENKESGNVIIWTGNYRDFSVFMRDQCQEVSQLEFLGVAHTDDGCGYINGALARLRDHAKSLGATHVLNAKVLRSRDAYYYATGDAFRLKETEKPKPQESRTI